MQNNGMGNALANEGTDEDFDNFFMDNVIEVDYR
jgi:hypothetical protein